MLIIPVPFDRSDTECTCVLSHIADIEACKHTSHPPFCSLLLLLLFLYSDKFSVIGAGILNDLERARDAVQDVEALAGRLLLQHEPDLV